MSTTVPLSVTVNGEKHESQVEPRQLLVGGCTRWSAVSTPSVARS